MSITSHMYKSIDGVELKLHAFTPPTARPLKLRRGGGFTGAGTIRRKRQQPTLVGNPRS